MPPTLSHSGSGGMDLRLIGEAVEPRVVLEPDSDGMDFGHTYTGDTSVRKFQLKNACSLGVRYNIELLGRNDVKGAKFSEFLGSSPIFTETVKFLQELQIIVGSLCLTAFHSKEE